MKKVNLFLVLGGAVSAGAYTAGVLDYLTSAIRQWNLQPNPGYEVKISAITGTSAGGMCGALLLADLYKGYKHSISEGSLYESWVNSIDIEGLTDTSDLKGNIPKSILNGNPIRKIAKHKLKFRPQTQAEKEAMEIICNEKFKLLLSVTNSRGVRYPFQFNNPPKHTYALTNHRDYVEFRLLDAKSNLSNNEDWEFLENTAIATGAFPVGLPTQLMTRKTKDISNNLGGISNLEKYLDSEFLESETYTYLAVDGGAVDNEPLGSIRSMMPKDTADTTNLIVMIDPFPNKERDYKLDEDDLVQMGLKAAFSVRDQALFKEKELVDAETRNTYFIAPEIPEQPDDRLQVAGGALMAFSGFFSKKYRQFDYDLGLANCDKFLKEHFQLLTDGQPNGNLILKPLSNYKYCKLRLPEVTLQDLRPALSQFKNRLSHVLVPILKKYLKLRFIGNPVRWLVKRKITKLVENEIIKTLHEENLLKL